MTPGKEHRCPSGSKGPYLRGSDRRPDNPQGNSKMEASPHPPMEFLPGMESEGHATQAPYKPGEWLHRANRQMTARVDLDVGMQK